MADGSSRRILLHRLTFVDEGDEVLVGRPDTASYAMFPPDGAELLRHLQRDADLDAAATWYTRTYGEWIDLEDFTETLHELGFVRAADAAPATPAMPGLRRLGAAVFSPPSAVTAILLLAAAAAVLVVSPASRPTPSHIFFTRSLIAVPLVMLAIEIPLMALHEFAHVLAGRRIGIESRVRVGRRLYFVVLQTTLTGIYSVPRRKRYLPFLAGLAIDAVVFCSLIIVSYLTWGTPVALLGRVAVAAAYFTAVRFCWQFLFFVETDLQHVLATALGCTDLRGLTRAYLRARWRPADRRPVAFTARELAVLRWFAPVTVLGVVATVTSGIATFTPLLIQYVRRVTEGVDGGVGRGSFWDALVSLVMIVGQLSIVLTLTVRDKRRAARTA